MRSMGFVLSFRLYSCCQFPGSLFVLVVFALSLEVPRCLGASFVELISPS